jgi:hypothetical protein
MAVGVEPQGPWKIILCAPLGAARDPVVVVGELVDARERVFNFTLNRPETISFQLPMEAPHAFDIMLQPDGLIVLTYNGTVKMVAEIQTLELVGDQGAQSIAVTCQSSMWVRLAKALIGDTAAGRKGPTSATDQGTWLKSTVLSDYNAKVFSSVSVHTGIGTGGTTTASGNISGGVWRYKPYIELVQELSASTAGFDFWQEYVDPRTGSAGTALTGNIGIAPIKGTTKTNVVFEYGTAQPNAQGYRFLTDTTNMITRAVSLPPDFPDNRGLKVVALNDATRAAVVGYRQELIDSDLSIDTLRTGLAQEHLDIRKNPRRLFEITPYVQVDNKRVPEALVDYDTGDIIRGRVLDHDNILIDGNVRVYGIQIEVGDDGVQTDTLTLVSEG